MKKQRWIDLSQHNVYLGSIKMADGVERLTLIDMDDAIAVDKVREAGFLPFEGSPRFDKGIYYLAGDQALRPSRIAAAMGIDKCPIVEVEVGEIGAVFRAKCLEKFQANLNAVTLRADVLGQNKDGKYVYQTPVGRFVRTSKSEAITERSSEGQAMSRAMFLRGANDEELRMCADGFVHSILQGHKTNWNDLVKFSRTVFGRDASDGELHRLQEAVEAAAYRSFAARTPEKFSQAAFELATSFYYGLPTSRMRTSESVLLHQHSTPLPMSLVAQRLLVGSDDLTGKTTLEPTGGNGSLLSMLPNELALYAIELDEKRLAALRENPRVQAEHGDATTVPFRARFGQVDGFDYTIANPPFGGLEGVHVFDKLKNIRRMDYLIALRTLAARKDHGRSVLIFGSDTMYSQGVIEKSGKAFLNYLHDHYQVHGLVELDGRLYSRQGSSYNVRIMVIGDKLAVPQIAQVPEVLPILSSYDELWQWAERVLESYHAPVPIADEKVLPAPVVLEQPAAEVVEAVQDPIVREVVINPAVPAVIEEVAVAVDASAIDAISPAFTTATNPPSVSVADAAVSVPQRRVNEFQTPYQPASKLGTPSGMIPINMAGATYAALNDLEAAHGSVDEYVARKLRYTTEQLGQYFSAEQIDALALAINSSESGRGIINADQTGMGKGRFVAGMMRYAKLNDKVPAFLTIKSELFTDIFRDIEDIGSRDLFKNLFIFNDGVHVMRFGTENDILYRATTVQDRRKALDDMAISSDTDMVLATYSQFQRAASKNLKSQLLTAISQKDVMLFLDESHVASGASNISAAVGEAVANSSGVVYSSATPLKGVNNFAIYNKVFPASVDLKSLPDTLRGGGEALQEAISANMARDGVIIRREHDFSKLTFVTRLPDESRQGRNIDAANKLSAVLGAMSYLAGDVSKMVSGMNKDFEKDWEKIPEKERKGGRMRASSMNFGSRLYSINRQFLLGIKIEEAVAACLDALQEGRKPVIAVENTGESLLRQVLSRRAGVGELEKQLEELDERDGALTDDEKNRREELRQQIGQALRSVRLEEPPQFRELLEVMLDRIGEIKVQGRYGDVSTEYPESEEYELAEEQIRDMIKDFPDLPLMPLDVIRHELSARNYPVSEVSGRTSSLSIVDGKWAAQFHPKADAVANVAGFQSGKYDAIIITRSGSTGISLHATDRFENSDTRQRDFIVLQKAANIAEFLQWLGRVNRKDQVSDPVITVLDSGLPAELRLTMMHNAKLRKLSANTTSNRENGNVEGDDIDLLNDVGDRVALEWLFENPDIADRLDIALPKDDDEDVSRFSQDCPYVNKLLGRLMMVEVPKQQEILDTLSRRFAERIEELDQRGENPFKVDVFEWGASIVKEEELQSGVLQPTGSTFDDAVKIVTLEFEQEVKPIRSVDLLDAISAGLRAYRADGPMDEAGTLHTYVSTLRGMADDALRKQLPGKLRDSEEALAVIMAKNELPQLAKAKEKQKFLFDNVEYFKPGASVTYSDLLKGDLKGIVTQVYFPTSSDDAFLLSKYTMKVVFPGDDRPKDISLATLFNQGQNLLQSSYRSIDPEKMEKYAYARSQASQTLQTFDEVPDGKITRRAHVLQGNIFRACELARQQALGAPILFSDSEGNRQRAVLLKDRITPEKVKALPIAMDAKDIMAYVDEFLKPDHPDHRSRAMFGGLRIYDASVKDMKKGDGIMFEVLNGGRDFRLTLPGTKSRAGRLMTDGAIFDVGDKSASDGLRLKLSGTKAFMSVDIRREQMPSVLRLMQINGHVGKFYLPEPDHNVIKALKAQYERERTIGNSATELDGAL